MHLPSDPIRRGQQQHIRLCTVARAIQMCFFILFFVSQRPTLLSIYTASDCSHFFYLPPFGGLANTLTHIPLFLAY